MRLLKTLVVAMGVILVLGFGALIYIIATRISTPKPVPAASVVVPPRPEPPPVSAPNPAPSPLPSVGQSLPQHFTPNFGEQTLMLPPGARVSDFSAGGDRLVLRVILADQTQQLVVVDLNTGAMIGTLNIENNGEPAPTSMLPALPSVTVPPRNRQEGGK